MNAKNPSAKGAPVKEPTAANRLGLDYAAEGARMGAPVVPIIDAHAHINGARAAAVWKRAADAFGVVRVYSQTQLAQADDVRAVLGDAVRFVAIPEYMAEDRAHAHTQGFLDNLEVWHERYGARMVKFWGAPRMRDYADEIGTDPEEMAPFDTEWRLRIAHRAKELGMALMVHVADPDTWFAAKYTDSSVYGTKRDQYESLHRLLDETQMRCLGAHMGGWPEDLGFLTELLARHPKLVLDTSATKWIVRELSKHPRDELLAFFEAHSERILFGSDIVTHDDHLMQTDPDDPKFGAQLANTEDEAFDLYASRYWALRTMLESDYDGESPIADPDLAMLDPQRYDAMSAPRLSGKTLPAEVLGVLYRGACEGTLEGWYGEG